MLVQDDMKRKLVATYGAYSVWHDQLPHRPYGLFRVYRGERYVAAQISWPSLSDCEWLDRDRRVYASSSYQQGSKLFMRGVSRRGS